LINFLWLKKLIAVECEKLTNHKRLFSSHLIVIDLINWQFFMA